MAKGKKNKAPIKKAKKPTAQKTATKAIKYTAAAPKAADATFIFGKINYMYMLAGAACLLIGLVLMSGGQMPDADTWDNSIIYSFRRITLAPMLMIVGLILEIMAIFKKG